MDNQENGIVENRRSESRTILVTGLTSLKLGAMETDNLGNFLIVESLYRSLRDYYKKANISTTLQLSKQFAERYNFEVLESERFWMYTRANYIFMKLEVQLARVWRFFSKLGLNLGFLLSTTRLNAFHKSDIIFDFHGDIFGDNALTKYHFYMGVLTPILAKILGKNIYCIASSLGPFGSMKSLKLAKKAFDKYDHISVREPITLNILNSIGYVGEKYTMHPCFSFGFKPYNQINDADLKQQEPELFKNSDNLVGLILCTHNMKEMPLNKWPRKEAEYIPFLDFVTHLVEKKKLKVCIFSHRYKFDQNNNILLGSDHSIVDQLIQLLPNTIKESDVFTLNGVYDASSMNKIISHFNVLASGRIHGAVQGIIQNIPTMIIDYANEPKAHKLKGFAVMTNLNEYIADPNYAESMIENFDKLYAEKDAVRNKLKKLVPKIIQKGKDVWRLLDESA
jgi:colanic acid/amylovoran biosynthesis protein